ncbi:hypothetical protein PRK78_002904 [Emydomyces testavorans]|uniref:Uncharacterized protein n=1 Tax=Emydomyces testavorans TaxID=2070801 RepID=A0AAF0DF85_9EURO|nr:hypothetical protein PRK78_002904 [Emydomyces testavorans]
MPHKHKRRRKDNDRHFTPIELSQNEADEYLFKSREHYDLPPNKIAKPLPTKSDNQSSSKKGQQTKDAKPKEKLLSHTNDFGNDTPREFARMMRKFQQSVSGKMDGNNAVSGNSGMDNEKSTQKRKRGGGEATTETLGTNNSSKMHKVDIASTSASNPQIPKILPGEKLSDFAIRVNQALPLSGVTRKAGNAGASKIDAQIRNLREHRQTKHEKRLLRLQMQWREEEARIREKEEEEKEEREADNEDVNETWNQWAAEAGMGKHKKKKKESKKKRKKGGAAAEGYGISDGSDDEDGDPWAKLNKKKRAVQRTNPFDVVQAPPEKLKRVKEIFKVYGIGGAKVDVANVPAVAGSLRRREELANHRQSIVEEYRRIIAAKRGQ